MNRITTRRINETDVSTTLYSEHTRHWESFEYVYPVISRRSRGLSIGVNLNPDTICNFDCVYCQVDKAEHPRPRPVDINQLETELAAMVLAATSGELWKHPRMSAVAPELRRLNDIAFSGDGEPTSAEAFPQAVRIVAKLKQTHALAATKIILITNATLLRRERVESAIQVMDNNHGEVWAKLDAGTEDYYKRIDRSAVRFQTILDNILACGKRRPIVIQSMFAKLHDQPTPDAEFEAYIRRISDLLNQGCQIKAVQMYTVARQTLEPYVTALPDDILAGMADKLRGHLPDTTDVDWFGETG